MTKRMTGAQRREQLIGIARELFAERGYEATSVEEVASRAGITKPVLYEHFGGKEGLYAVVVDREVNKLLDRITRSLDGDDPRKLIEQAADALLSYIEDEPDGFRVLVRDSPMASSGTGYAHLISDVAERVTHIFTAQFKQRKFPTKLAPIYAHALVGMVSVVGQWWLEEGKPSRQVVAAHLVNLAWNGLSDLERQPSVPEASDHPARPKLVKVDLV